MYLETNNLIYLINSKNLIYNYYFSYFHLVLLLIFFFIISFIILYLSLLLVTKTAYKEKLLPYECGFEPYEDARNVFNVQFYLIGLFFLIFDLESLYLYPLVFSLSTFSLFNFYVLLDFFLELFIGYIFIFKFIKLS